MATDFRALLEALLDGGVEFVIIGGVALVLQGSARTTQDLDVCYSRDPENLVRLAAALASLQPTLRGAPKDLPFRLDPRTLQSGLNFTLETDAGDLDLMGEVTGVGGYREIEADATQMALYGRRVKVMGLSTLESAKRAAGRLKDLADLAEIREIRKRTAT
jgi:predicted nucleotidyltransferase